MLAETKNWFLAEMHSRVIVMFFAVKSQVMKKKAGGLGLFFMASAIVATL
jgi:hypothetical protein